VSTKPESKASLSPYRVLDSSEGGCMVGGRILADLGADVIQIEPPGGSPSRIAPFYKDIQDPEKSLFWFAYNTNKRGITLDLTKVPGRNLFKKLVMTTDIVIESYAPGYMDSLNLSYKDLCKIKPDIIMASITAFGQNGPKAYRKSSDLTTWASGGYMNTCGEPDRAPVWISFPQTALYGGTEAAMGALTALWHRQNTGEGQYVDVSMQECAGSPTLNVLPMWDANQVDFKRIGGYLYVPTTGVRQPIYFRCRDGYVMILVQGGNEPFVSSSTRLTQWMIEAGMAPDWLKKLNWVTDYDASTMDQDLADRVGEAVGKFTITRTKAELYETGAFRKRILLAPLSSTKDISEDVQLEFRGFWVKIAHPELEEALTYSGPFIRMSETPVEFRMRAPLIGEHNPEVYGKELGLSQEEIKNLKSKGII
jgi:benzylsuccinate CoA-transferase BbsE subunit